MLKKLRNYFMAGIIVLLPAAVTLYFLWLLFNFLDGYTGKIFIKLIGWDIPGLGLLLTIATVLIVGLLASSLVGRTLINFFENIMTRIPLIRSIYLTVKKVVEAFNMRNREAFRHVVMIEYPRRGIYALAFTTGETKGEVQEKTGHTVINVFLPTTPNPTSGFFLLVPQEDIIYLDMTVEEGLKMIISGGIVTPPFSKSNKEGDLEEGASKENLRCVPENLK